MSIEVVGFLAFSFLIAVLVGAKFFIFKD